MEIKIHINLIRKIFLLFLAGALFLCVSCADREDGRDSPLPSESGDAVHSAASSASEEQPGITEDGICPDTDSSANTEEVPEDSVSDFETTQAASDSVSDPPETPVSTDSISSDYPETVEPPETEEPAVTGPAYIVKGDFIDVNGIKAPNNNHYTSGPMIAVDDLGRPLSTAEESKNYTENRYVGVFYFLWLGEHGDYGIFDITKILEAGGEAAKSGNYSGWGPYGAMHFFAEPLYGYYYSSDEWVMRKHVEELTNANVDFLYLDVTNGYAYVWNALKLMQILHEFNEQGWKAPQVVFYTRTQNIQVVRELYDSIYAQNLYADTWFCYEGKPVIVCDRTAAATQLSSEINAFFTFRNDQWPTEAKKEYGWPWMDFSHPQSIFYAAGRKPEAISVSVAQHSGTIRFSDSGIYGENIKYNINCGRSYRKGKNNITEDSYLYGYNFEEQWQRAIKADTPIVLVTGWNEWVAQRQRPGSTEPSDKLIFIDTATLEFSRDIEMTRGGYFDNYYMQLAEQIRQYKGTAPTLIQNIKQTIDLSGSFSQWDSVLVTYRDFKGDTAARDSLSFGNIRLNDASGRNDLVAAKVAYDERYLYFYVECAQDISGYETDSSWMQLFINIDNDQTGWYGFDYIVNYKAQSDNRTGIAKAEADGREYRFSQTQENAEYKISGRQMMLRVPLSALGVTDPDTLHFTFKWADSRETIRTMEQFYTSGDSAPHGRMNFVFQNCR